MALLRTSSPMYHIVSMGSLLGVSESAGSLQFSFCTPSTPPSTYACKLVTGVRPPAGDSRNLSKGNEEIRCELKPHNEKAHLTVCSFLRARSALPPLANRMFLLAVRYKSRSEKREPLDYS